MSRPDTFIVGAPRCGTTWLFEQLGHHPDVASSEIKEPVYFGRDLQAMRSRGRDRRSETLEEYLARFPAGASRRTLEASAVYLFSRDALAEIAEFEPAARLIVMVRDPIEQIRSLHGLRLTVSLEADVDLVDALDHEVDRRGEASPLTGLVRGYPYKRLTRYAEQLERAFESFPRDQVHVVVHDDLRADPAAVHADVLRFLDLAPQRVAHTSAVNTRGALRSVALARTLRYPPAGAGRLVRTLIPSVRLRMALRRRARALNRTEARPRPLDPALRKALADELRPDVRRLELLLDLDLSHWLAPGGGGG